MVHGLALSGGAMMALVAGLYALQAMAAPEGSRVPVRQASALAWLAVGMAVLLWLSVLSGTYVVFPLYRATPPEGAVSLAAYPRALLLSQPATSWLHSFGMEIKEHLPWMAAMVATAVAFVSVQYRQTLLADRSLRGMVTVLLLVCLVLTSIVALMGVFINKIAPLQ